MTSEHRQQPTPIFLTGLPRSGTTWASRAIKAATGARLVHEPFNWKKYPERIEHHMKYVPACSGETEIIRILRREIEPTLGPFSRLFGPQRVVVKDVHICLAVEHVWEMLRPLTIILVRHPCAVANSWARLGLDVLFRLDLLLAQEELLRDHLSPYRDHLARTNDYFQAMGAYWGATYHVLKSLADQHPEWQWTTHEALCLRQEVSYERILKELGVCLEEAGRESLRRFLARHNRPRQRGEGAYSVIRVGEKEVDKWKSQLTAKQARSVIDGATPFAVWSELYGHPATS